jgi:hypothetical protein
MKVLMVPLDDRPVTYLLPQLIARIAGCEAMMPPRNLMGSLKQSANLDAIFNWIDNALSTNKIEAVFVCADTLIHGGLINSRRSTETHKELQTRLNQMASWKKKAPQTPVFVQSSIMRISDNHDNVEEKEYWARYGREIFTWSTNLHRLANDRTITEGVVKESEMRIPEAIRQDYLATRFRNFQINQNLIDLVKSGHFARLIFSLDDSGEFGLNVLEQEKLNSRLKYSNLTERAFSYAGADEVLCSMFAYWLAQTKIAAPPAAQVFYALPATEFCLSRYEGQSVGNSVRAQMKACGIKAIDADSDRNLSASFHVVIHGGENGQGDHILLPGHQDLRAIDTREAVAATLAILEQSTLPCVLCDVAYANGADPLLIEKLLEHPKLLAKLCGYAGWNTSGNTLGSALAMAVACWFKEFGQGHGCDPISDTSQALKEAICIRLGDDWAYQTQVRKNLSVISRPHLQEQMRPYLRRIEEAIGSQFSYENVSFPWQRAFEVEISKSGSRETQLSAN